MKNCLNCKDELPTRHKARKYCSDSCRVSAYIKRAGYKPLGNVKSGTTEIAEKTETSFENNVLSSALGSGIALIGKSIFEEPKATKKEIEALYVKFAVMISKIEFLKKNILKLGENQKIIYDKIQSKNQV